MSGYDRVKQLFSFTRSTASGIFRNNLAFVSEWFSGIADGDKRHQARRAFQSLVLPMLLRGGVISESRRTVYRRLLEEQLDRADAEHHLAELDSLSPLTEAEAIRALLEISPEQLRHSAEMLLALAVALGESPDDLAEARRVAVASNLSEDEFEALHRQLSGENARKQRLLRSGRGLIVALIIIVIFVLTAKFLQSVIFGLILAFIMQPLEKFFERALSNRGNPVYWLIFLLELPVAPLRRLSRLITRRGFEPAEPEDAEKLRRERLIRRAVSLTFIVTLLCAAAAFWGVTKLTGRYMREVQKNVRVLGPGGQTGLENQYTALARTNYYLEKLRRRFEALPPVRYGLDFLSRLINDPELRAKSLEALLDHSGGIFSFTTGMVGSVISLLGNTLLAVFFALLFLGKMAALRPAEDGKTHRSEHLVRVFFNGIWLPGADENVIAEAGRIIGGVLFRLRVWLKGYLTLILVDSTFYTTSFFFLGVPYFLPLGILAGCGIALPYLGPVLSCAATLLVTLACGGASGNLLVAIIICYLIYNGIIEQFILYPAVIGESLGLSTLETIIMVLLGAIFAGIPGMILALPAASAAKYIIPQIYRGLTDRKKQP